jgi:hypothetical protein
VRLILYSRNNAEDITQSVQRVVDYFAVSYRVSTYLWDTITIKKVGEYNEGNLKDGCVLNTTANSQTGIIISYPKFKTRFGAYISFKKGIWNPRTQIYNSDNLKVINVPVLKLHGSYGVIASPGSGPRSSYNAATNTGIIAASTDPAALDYWTSNCPTI